MTKNSKTLSSGLEDYIETIYIAQLKNLPLKGADLARQLCVSRASVSEALAKLVAKKLITYNSYETISLTPLGIEFAQNVYNKHHTLKMFFEQVLFIAPDEAGENACKIEHIISQNVLNRLAEFTEFCRQNEKFLTEFKKEITRK